MKPQAGFVITGKEIVRSDETGHIEDVRSNIHVTGFTEIIKSQLSRLDFKCVGNGWQSDFWNRFLEEDIRTFLPDILDEALFYNVGYGNPFFVQYPRILFTKIKTLDSQFITNDYYGERFYYRGTQFNQDHLFEYRLKKSNHIKTGDLLWFYVAGIRVFENADVSAGAHSAGILLLNYKNPGHPTAEEQQKADDFVKGWLNNQMVGGALAGWDAKTVNTNDGTERIAQIKNFKSSIAGVFNLKWLDVGTDSVGSYAAKQIDYVQFKGFIDYLADKFCESCKDYADKISWWNQEPNDLAFTHSSPETFGVDPKTLIDSLNILTRLPLTREQIETIYPKLDLPIPQITETTEKQVNPVIADMVKSPLVAAQLIKDNTITGDEIRTNIGLDSMIDDNQNYDQTNLNDQTIDNSMTTPEEPSLDMNQSLKEMSDRLSDKKLEIDLAIKTTLNKAMNGRIERFRLSGWSKWAEIHKKNPVALQSIFERYGNKINTVLRVFINQKVYTVNSQMKNTIDKIWKGFEQEVKTWNNQ